LRGEGLVEEINSQEQDHGILSLVIAARILGVPAEYDQLFYCVPHENKEIGLLQAAQDMGLKSKIVHTDISHIAKMAFPIIAVLKDSDYGVIIKADEKHLLVFDCAQKRPRTLTYEKFASTWTGRFIFLTEKFKLKRKKNVS